MNDETVAELAKDLRPQSFSSFWSTTTHAAWREIPITHVLCLKDRPTTVVAARYLVETVRTSDRHKIDNVIEIETGHSPCVSRREWTAEIEAGRRAWFYTRVYHCCSVSGQSVAIGDFINELKFYHLG